MTFDREQLEGYSHYCRQGVNTLFLRICILFQSRGALVQEVAESWEPSQFPMSVSSITELAPSSPHPPASPICNTAHQWRPGHINPNFHAEPQHDIYQCFTWTNKPRVFATKWPRRLFEQNQLPLIPYFLLWQSKLSSLDPQAWISFCHCMWNTESAFWYFGGFLNTTVILHLLNQLPNENYMTTTSNLVFILNMNSLG